MRFSRLRPAPRSAPRPPFSHAYVDRSGIVRIWTVVIRRISRCSCRLVLGSQIFVVEAFDPFGWRFAIFISIVVGNFPWISFLSLDPRLRWIESGGGLGNRPCLFEDTLVGRLSSACGWPEVGSAIPLTKRID